ncbi:MAG: molybdopterin-dependent oxidoreductase [Chloroflexi bacterium]|nr:molybdopterin-dependent oxidoreductase [Chloroflexota bacterium]
MPSIPVFCGKDCGGNACPLTATLENGRVTHVANNPAAGKYLLGCSRGYNLPSELYAPDRVLQPLIRVGERGSGRFRAASWEEALRLIADRLADVRAKFGAGAVLNLSSAGSTSALHGTGPLLRRFLNLYGGATRCTGSYSTGASQFVLPYLFGNQWKTSGFDAATMQYAEMIVLWGANVLEARLGTEINARLLEAARRGAQIVAIDPRRTRTAQKTGAWWIPCRPGADAALMLAVLYLLLKDDRVDRAFVAAHSTGFEQLEAYILGQDGGQARTPRWAEPLCGVSAEEITRFARAYAAAKPAMLLPGYSIQRVYAGEEPYRLAVALQLITGNFGKLGGSTGSLNNRLPGPRVGMLPVPAVPNQPSVPVTRWPDAVLEGRSGGYPEELHAIYSVGGNYLNQGAQITKNIAALQKVDFAVCHEIFLTPTARYCDVVLPAAHALEKEDIGLPWAGNFLTYKPQAVPPRGGARTDYDILCDLAERLGFGAQFSEGRTAAQWVQHFLDQSEVPDHDAFRRSGFYIAPDQERVGLADFTRDPTAHPLSTPSGLVEIASERYGRETGFPAIPTWQTPPQDERYPLLLITPKSPHRTHSQGSNLAEIRRKAAHALDMHPTDAAARGIGDGDQVRLFNAAGVAQVAVRLCHALAPGVVCLPEGVWVELDGDGLDTAGAANMFTCTQGTAPATACIMHGVGVQVSRCPAHIGS